MCRNGDGYPQGSIYDIPIRFLINNYYSCQILLNYEEYKNFCLNKDWRNLKIFNFARRLQLIGIFGNAKIDSHDVLLIKQRIGLKLLMISILKIQSGQKKI